MSLIYLDPTVLYLNIGIVLLDKEICQNSIKTNFLVGAHQTQQSHDVMSGIYLVTCLIEQEILVKVRSKCRIQFGVLCSANSAAQDIKLDSAESNLGSYALACTAQDHKLYSEESNLVSYAPELVLQRTLNCILDLLLNFTKISYSIGQVTKQIPLMTSCLF